MSAALNTRDVGTNAATAVAGFVRSWMRSPHRPALEVGGATLTYAQLGDRAASIAATLAVLTPEEGPPLTGVFAYRTATAYAAVLGVLLRGHGYVPLNRRLPVERTRSMLERAGCRAIVCDSASAAQLDRLLVGIEDPLLVLLPDADDVRGLAAKWPRHRFVAGPELAAPDAVDAAPAGDDLAYVLFTSGSTGVPKGVMVSHHNVAALVAYGVERFAVSEDDRLSQAADLTFDLSVFDMFVAWTSGACLCCPSENALFRPSRFLRDAAVTVWFSVPATATFMQAFGMLKPGSYPTLRHTLFAGEPLLLDVARAWRRAAPNSLVHNLYGPTELTVVCTGYEWDDERSPGECDRGTVPIGAPLPGMTGLVVDSELRPVPDGCEGELLMTGPQLARGYWRDAERTAAAFVVPPGASETFYRTGDRVLAGSGGLLFRGRLDDQIKVLGHRVELGDVEAALREATGSNTVAAVGWPRTPTGVGGIAAFVAGGGVDARAVREQVTRRLPDYMVPRRIEPIRELPLNANGKVDRRRLLDLLESHP